MLGSTRGFFLQARRSLPVVFTSQNRLTRIFWGSEKAHPQFRQSEKAHLKFWQVRKGSPALDASQEKLTCSFYRSEKVHP